jgi:pantoate--beta-alanine ligase
MAIRVAESPADLRGACDAVRARGGRIGFVPTMGSLHRGHLALVEEARRRADVVVASIFVNPTQFAPTDDLARYPRDLDGDVRKLASAGTEVVFAPEVSALYAAGDETRVRVGSLAEPLEGRHRPGHFEGVATVVAKLLVLVGGCVAVFGRKDYQQLLVVRRMVRDLFLPVHVVGHVIVRDPDGLAMSSRNAYLSPDERTRALAIARGLDAAVRRFADGERNARTLEGLARQPIAAAADSIDYVEVRDPEELDPITGDVGGRALLAVACRIGSTRLIDNVVLGEDASPLGGGGP